jgi:Ala-tRNA(Pro) deacylase
MKGEQIKQTLSDLEIEFQEFTHPAVFTCAEAHKIEHDIPGIPNKNLFLRNKKGDQYFMLTLPQTKMADLKAIGQQLGIKGLSFASPERMMKVLDIEPGSVGLLSLINDSKDTPPLGGGGARPLTNVYIDEDLFESEWIQSHPGINTSTVAFKTSGIETFLNHTGHHFSVITL